MITLEQARQVAAKRLGNIGRCMETDTAYVFFSSGGPDTDGGPDAPLAVRKDTGEVCSLLQYIAAHGGRPVRNIEL